MGEKCVFTEKWPSDGRNLREGGHVFAHKERPRDSFFHRSGPLGYENGRMGAIVFEAEEAELVDLPLSAARC